jgi:CRP-like cAMP-binding protein
MTPISAEACLARARAFELLDAEGRTRLAALAEARPLAAGEVLMREGEAGDAFYLLVRGLLRVEAEDLAAQPQRVATIEPGAVLGEIGVVTREPRTATVTADTDAEVLRFEMLGVLSVLKDYPQVLAELNRLGLERSEATLERLLAP